MIDSGSDIGLFGGSFDPVHKGHVAIAESFLESGYISELWVLLTPDPPHKDQKALSEYEQRMEMLRVAFQDMNRVVVSDLENNLPRPSYTVQTLKYLTDKYSENSFYLCIGEDSLHDFKKWKNWEEILTYCELLVARRSTSEALNVNSKIAEKTHLVSHHPIDISSTAIREAVAEGEDITDLVPEQVKDLIERYNLYKEES